MGGDTVVCVWREEFRIEALVFLLSLLPLWVFVFPGLLFANKQVAWGPKLSPPQVLTKVSDWPEQNIPKFPYELKKKKQQHIRTEIQTRQRDSCKFWGRSDIVHEARFTWQAIKNIPPNPKHG